MKQDTRRQLFRTAAASLAATAMINAIPFSAPADAAPRDPRFADPADLIVISPVCAVHPGHILSIEVIDVPWCEGFSTESDGKGGRVAISYEKHMATKSSWLNIHMTGNEVQTELLTPPETWALATRLVCEARDPYVTPSKFWTPPLVYTHPDYRVAPEDTGRTLYQRFLKATTRARWVSDQMRKGATFQMAPQPIVRSPDGKGYTPKGYV